MNTDERTLEIMRTVLGASDHKDVDLPLDRTLDDAGFDSLDKIELAMALEHEHGTEVSDDEFEGIETVADVLRKVREMANG